MRNPAHSLLGLGSVGKSSHPTGVPSPSLTFRLARSFPSRFLVPWPMAQLHNERASLGLDLHHTAYFSISDKRSTLPPRPRLPVGCWQSQHHFCPRVFIISSNNPQAAPSLHRISCRKCRKPHSPGTKRHLQHCLENTCKTLETTTSSTCGNTGCRRGFSLQPPVDSIASFSQGAARSRLPAKFSTAHGGS